MNYIKSKEDFITKFLAHLGTSAIMDLLLQMVVAAPATDQVRMDLAEVSKCTDVYWLEEWSHFRGEFCTLKQILKIQIRGGIQIRGVIQF